MTEQRQERERLGSGSYLLLTTFRRSGRAVPTPVWVVQDTESLLVWTVRDSGKVKRIRNSGYVLLAPCDMRGRPTGPETTGHAEISDDRTLERCRQLLVRKYRLTGRLALLGSRLRRSSAGTIALRITLG